MKRHYGINKSLRSIGQYACLAGMAVSFAEEIIGATTATISLINKYNNLFFVGVSITCLSYLNLRIFDKFDRKFESVDIRNRPNKLEQRVKGETD